MFLLLEQKEFKVLGRERDPTVSVVLLCILTDTEMAYNNVLILSAELDEFLQSGHIHSQGLERYRRLSTVFLKSSVRSYTTYKLTTTLSSLQTS